MPIIQKKEDKANWLNHLPYQNFALLYQEKLNEKKII